MIPENTHLGSEHEKLYALEEKATDAVLECMKEIAKIRELENPWKALPETLYQILASFHPREAWEAAKRFLEDSQV